MRTHSITAMAELTGIIERCQWCHVSMVTADGKPYVIPMNFGLRDNVLYIHGAGHGKKIDILSKHPEVCINFSTDHLLRYQNEDVACSWSMKYRSVLCYGKVEFIAGEEEKRDALDVIMGQYSPKKFKYNPPSVREVCVMRIPITHMEGRSFGY